MDRKLVVVMLLEELIRLKKVLEETHKLIKEHSFNPLKHVNGKESLQDANIRCAMLQEYEHIYRINSTLFYQYLEEIRKYEDILPSGTPMDDDIWPVRPFPSNQKVRSADFDKGWWETDEAHWHLNPPLQWGRPYHDLN